MMDIDFRSRGGFLSREPRIRLRMRKPQVREARHVNECSASEICVLVLGYLVAALLWPEKF